MEQERRIRLMLRQIVDAQMQAEKILAGDTQRETIETFARFCAELNDYIRKYAEREEVLATLAVIPEIQYRQLPGSFLQYFFIPNWVVAIRKSAVREQIRCVRETYARLELQLRGMNFDRRES
jgi:hypothetical protein